MILDASEDLGIVMLTNYHGLPRETFDSFGWHKSFVYDFTITPPAYAPVSINYGKRYIEYDKLTINNSYDNGLRIYKKTNSRFNNEVPFGDKSHHPPILVDLMGMSNVG